MIEKRRERIRSYNSLRLEVKENKSGQRDESLVWRRGFGVICSLALLF